MEQSEKKETVAAEAAGARGRLIDEAPSVPAGCGLGEPAAGGTLAIKVRSASLKKV